MSDDKRNMSRGNVSSGTYGLAFIGALVYFIQHATSFGEGVLGFFKALLWPVFVIYNLLEHLHM
ncbi:MAG: hypothetical protein Q8916_12175 [Bacteroidota bacterium]|nr:hypothetical protein [Bacteroidota bacterium]MDP4231149.1 hypothetical protein [Bacteroidota bacterium]MDP4236078.1 hypothetical protein [Bacteroidota bacterium]